MPKLREGDIVTFRARVTRVADYDDGQQIMATILPKGKEIGWCLPKENAYTPAEFVFKQGDQVTVAGRPYSDTYEILALFPERQVAIRKTGCWPIEMTTLEHLKRI